MAHPGVADVAVIGVPHEKWGETPKALVVRAAGSDVAAAEVIAYSRTRLAHYKCPTSVEFLADLPRNPSGKVLKRELRRRFVPSTAEGASR
jgi:long-chain acyl-CoA synthetase